LLFRSNPPTSFVLATELSEFITKSYKYTIASELDFRKKVESGENYRLSISQFDFS
jgi:hypothetical protein